MFFYSGGTVTGHWTPEGTGSGITHVVNGGEVQAGGTADLGPGVIVKISGWTIKAGGALTMTGTASAPPLLTSWCDTSADAGGDTQCGSGGNTAAHHGQLTIEGNATVTATDAAVRRIDVTGGTNAPNPDDAIAVEGSVASSEITDSSLTFLPASLTWTDNDFTRSPMRHTLGDELEFTGNNLFEESSLTTNSVDDVEFARNGLYGASSLSISTVEQPHLADNHALASPNPISVSQAEDLSGIEPNNDALGATEAERTILLADSKYKTGTSAVIPNASKAIYHLQRVDIHGQLTVQAGALIDISGELEIESGGSLLASGAAFRSYGAGSAEVIEGGGGSTMIISGGSIEGSVRGECEVPGIALMSVTGVAFSGTGRFERCNTQSPAGGAKASATGNSGVTYRSFHVNTCVGNPVPPPGVTPAPYPRKIWDVDFGMPDDPVCLPTHHEDINSLMGY